jgi:hypothetical protein
MSAYTIIRNIRGGWPNWLADLDDGRVLYVHVRSGEFCLGLGQSKDEAMYNSGVVRHSEAFAGVTDVIDALVALRENGFYYVAPER